MNIKCWICGKDHALFWLEGNGGTRSLSMNCNRVDHWTKPVDGSKPQLRRTTRTLHVDKHYTHLLDGNPDEASLPIVVTGSRAKELRNRNQLEMMPLLKRDHEKRK